MPSGIQELAFDLRRLAQQASAQASAMVATELGVITDRGVRLDRFPHEFTDPLVLEPVVDCDIEVSLEVPAHQETGKIVLPAIPTSGGGPTVAGEYAATFKFDKWVHDAKAQGFIKVTKARLKFRPQYKPGDRVVCALVHGGRDVVILARVVPYA
ncbi:MAG: hypothetical protein IMX00_04205 [Limnochordales bacterium]|nr:hypothetical protein [Limnochordales bacterium]